MELFFIQRLLGFERGFACDSRVVRWILFPDLPLSYEQNGFWPNMTSNSGIPKGWHLGLLLFATQINNVLSVSKCSIYTLIQQQSLIAATPSFYLVADPSLSQLSLNLSSDKVVFHGPLLLAIQINNVLSVSKCSLYAETAVKLDCCYTSILLHR